MTACACQPAEFPFRCDRHDCEKVEHWHHLCQTREDYFQLWEQGRGPGQNIQQQAQPAFMTCQHRGPELRRELCPSCNGHVELKVYTCAVRGECTIGKPFNSIPCCFGCRSHAAPDAPPQERIIIHDGLSPGDITVLTAAVKALHDNFPGKYLIDVRTPCPALWEHSPYIANIPDGGGRYVTTNYDPDRLGIDAYATVNQSSQRPIHMLEAYCEGLAAVIGIPALRPKNWLEPSIFLSPEEKIWLPQIEGDYWVVNAGIKPDCGVKLWNGYTETIRRTADKIKWVQVGSPEHIHTPIEGAINLIGQTDLRQLVRLVYHARGVLCGVTALQHLAHWVERKNNQPRRAVIVAGGRESPHWFAYPGQQIFHTIGELPCCTTGGCWKSYTPDYQLIPASTNWLCERPKGNQGECMERITPESVANMVLRVDQ